MHYVKTNSSVCFGLRFQPNHHFIKMPTAASCQKPSSKSLDQRVIAEVVIANFVHTSYITKVVGGSSISVILLLEEDYRSRKISWQPLPQAIVQTIAITYLLHQVTIRSLSSPRWAPLGISLLQTSPEFRSIYLDIHKHPPDNPNEHNFPRENRQGGDHEGYFSMPTKPLVCFSWHSSLHLLCFWNQNPANMEEFFLDESPERKPMNQVSF